MWRWVENIWKTCCGMFLGLWGSYNLNACMVIWWWARCIMICRCLCGTIWDHGNCKLYLLRLECLLDNSDNPNLLRERLNRSCLMGSCFRVMGDLIRLFALRLSQCGQILKICHWCEQCHRYLVTCAGCGNNLPWGICISVSVVWWVLISRNLAGTELGPLFRIMGDRLLGV